MKMKIGMTPLQNSVYPAAADVSRLHFSWIFDGISAYLRPLLKFCRSLKILLKMIAVIAGLWLSPLNLMAEGAGTNSAEVTIDNFNFTPPALTVSAGTKVTWVNKDDVPHTVTSDDKLFGSRALDTDDTFSFTFQTPGTYAYYCSVHPKMTGKVIVK
ncbi:MAG TPA: cupredoxin family copper-binding protein [Verrucomicrobiae bacterium]|nr:cupredoxin family copper-binding protein [Verrucomicrobiae bacterium]